MTLHSPHCGWGMSELGAELIEPQTHMKKWGHEVTPYLLQGFLEVQGTQGVGQLPTDWQSSISQLDTWTY